MRLQHWLVLVAVVVGMGWLQVAQRNAVLFKGYAVGERMRQVHTQETEVAWLHAEVETLQSPIHLARVAQERRLKLVAWSPLATQVLVPRAVAAAPAASPLVHVAAVDPDRADAGDDTSD